LGNYEAKMGFFGVPGAIRTLDPLPRRWESQRFSFYPPFSFRWPLKNQLINTVELPDALNINFAEQGDSSPVPLLLLHGYVDSWYSFELVLPYLPESIHTFALTQRGHGESSRPATGYSVQVLAADLLDFMDKLNLEKAVITGGSSGGITARRFAIDHPERTLGLVLLGSPLSMRDKPGVLELWNSTISKLTDPIDPNFVREFAKAHFRRQYLKSIWIKS